MRIESTGVVRSLDFHRPKHGMGHERRKTIVRTLQCDLQNVFVEWAGAERVGRRTGGGGAFDVGEQLCVWREWSNLERALPGTYEIFRRNFFAVGPARGVSQIENTATNIVFRFLPRTR